MEKFTAGKLMAAIFGALAAYSAQAGEPVRVEFGNGAPGRPAATISVGEPAPAPAGSYDPRRQDPRQGAYGYGERPREGGEYRGQAGQSAAPYAPPRQEWRGEQPRPGGFCPPGQAKKGRC